MRGTRGRTASWRWAVSLMHEDLCFGLIVIGCEPSDVKPEPEIAHRLCELGLAQGPLARNCCRPCWTAKRLSRWCPIMAMPTCRKVAWGSDRLLQATAIDNSNM